MTVADPLLEWATGSGRHALAAVAFLALLAILVAATQGGSWAQRPAGQRRRPEHSGISEDPYLSTVTAGAAVVGVGLTIFAFLALKILAGDSALREADQAFSEALGASLSPLARQTFGLLTHLGDTSTLTVLCLVVAIFLVAAGHHRLAVGWVVALAGNGAINQGLKHLVGRARPLLPAGGGIESGYSFPSGHSSGTTVAFGMLAYLAFRLLPARWHGTAWLTALALTVTVGASRAFLQVHFASDVLAGFASGTVWLALCVTGLELLRRRAS